MGTGDEQDAAERSGERGGGSAHAARDHEGKMPHGPLSRFARGGSGPASVEDEPEASSPTLARVRVADGEAMRPFMRGILVHSLTEKGVAFEDAYEIAQAVWLQVRDRVRVTKDELRALVDELARARLEGSPSGSADPTRAPRRVCSNPCWRPGCARSRPSRRPSRSRASCWPGTARASPATRCAI